MAEERRRTRKKERIDTSPSREVAMVRCPYCHDDVAQDALAARCALCQTVHHTSCFDEKRGCSVAGCAGKAAHVVKGWRDAFGDCRACKAKIYLDENVALCKACETPHHPSCLEARAGCAECGSGEGMLVHAGSYRRTSASASRIAWWFFGGGLFLILPASLVASLVTKQLWPDVALLPFAVVGGIRVLAIFALFLGSRIVSGGKRRAMNLGQTKAVKSQAAVKDPPPEANTP